MIARPCAACGDVIASGTYCTHCKPDPGPRTHIAWRNDARWKNLSKRLRRLSPFCEFCSTTDNLSVDHIIPVDYEELCYAEENCRVLCKPCNSRRGNRFTLDEAEAVLKRLENAYQRRPTKSGRERVNAALRAFDQGGCPEGVAAPTVGKAQGALHTTREGAM